MSSAVDPDPTCWFAAVSKVPCEGTLARCHLISKQRLRQEYPEGAVWLSGHPQAFSWASLVRDGLLHRDGGPEVVKRVSLKELQDDERTWVPGCERHHAAFDGYDMKPPRGAIPVECVAFVENLRLGAFLDLDRRFDQAA